MVVTTPDLKSLVEALAGDMAEVESLVPPGADAEAFEPRPGHLALLNGAALVVRVGLGYDDWFDRLLGQSGNERVRRGREGYLDASTDIALLEVQGRSVEAQGGHAHGSANPHYWLDPANAEIISAHIADALARVAPERREAIETSQGRFRARLKDAIARWTKALEPHRGAPIVTYHNGWPYFARRFRLNVVGVIEPKEGVPPAAAQLAALAGRMRQERVRVVVREPFEPEEAPRFLAERTGARLVVLAPSVGAVEGTGDYFALFEHNVRVLAEALAGRS